MEGGKGNCVDSGPPGAIKTSSHQETHLTEWKCLLRVISGMLYLVCSIETNPKEVYSSLH